MISVGDIVQFVDDSNMAYRSYHEIHRGGLYTVESVREYNNGVGITLSETKFVTTVIDGKTKEKLYRTKFPYNAKRFRKIDFDINELFDNETKTKHAD